MVENVAEVQEWIISCFLANQKYHLINNCYHIFLDGILSDENKEIKVEDDKRQGQMIHIYALSVFIMKTLKSWDYFFFNL